MNNERFAVPELLFRPSDVGVQEMGITEALVHAVGTTPEGYVLLNTLVSFIHLCLCMRHRVNRQCLYNGILDLLSICLFCNIVLVSFILFILHVNILVSSGIWCLTVTTLSNELKSF